MACGRTLRARPVDTRHRGRLHRRDRPAASVAAAVSEITEKLWAEYEDFCKRDLTEHAVAYLFIDGIAERLRPGQRREAVLTAWGIGEDGRKSLLGLMAGSKEDVGTVRAFFQDLRARGLGDPLLVVSDGAPGIIRAIDECSPARRAGAVWRIGRATSQRRSRPILGPNSTRGSEPAIRRPRARSPVNRRPGSRRRDLPGPVSPAWSFQQIQTLTCGKRQGRRIFMLERPRCPAAAGQAPKRCERIR